MQEKLEKLIVCLFFPVHVVRGCTLLLLLGQLTLPFCMCDPGERYLSSPFAFTCEPALLLFAKAAFGLLTYIITFKTAALYVYE